MGGSEGRDARSDVRSRMSVHGRSVRCQFGVERQVDVDHVEARDQRPNDAGRMCICMMQRCGHLEPLRGSAWQCLVEKEFTHTVVRFRLRTTSQGRGLRRPAGGHARLEQLVEGAEAKDGQAAPSDPVASRTWRFSYVRSAALAERGVSLNTVRAAL
jgi:hypothetical protein